MISSSNFLCLQIIEQRKIGKDMIFLRSKKKVVHICAIRCKAVNSFPAKSALVVTKKKRKSSIPLLHKVIYLGIPYKLSRADLPSAMAMEPENGCQRG